MRGWERGERGGAMRRSLPLWCPVASQPDRPASRLSLRVSNTFDDYRIGLVHDKTAPVERCFGIPPEAIPETHLFGNDPDGVQLYFAGIEKLRRRLMPNEQVICRAEFVLLALKGQRARARANLEGVVLAIAVYLAPARITANPQNSQWQCQWRKRPAQR